MSNFKSYIWCIIFILFVSCDELIGVEDISNHKVSLLAPVNGAEINDTIFSINWENLNGAELYRLQVFTPNVEEAVQIIIDSTSTNNQIQIELDEGDYELRLWAENSAYQSLYSFRQFTITP